MEHLAFASPLPLRECCEKIRTAIELPEFIYDYENATEWGLVEVDNIEYNVSRPYDDGTLQEWDDTVPPDCNFGVSLIIYREHAHAGDHEWATAALVEPFIRKATRELGVPIFHHRTWIPSETSA